VVATLSALARKGALDRQLVAEAIRDLGLDPEKAYPACV
jgi:pyruvate dehydrogenase complex dehydrogenase (E1) component